MDAIAIRRFGGTAALLMGVLYVLVIPTSALTFLMARGLADPASPSDPANLFSVMANAPISFTLIGLEFGTAALLGFAVVPAVASLVGPASPAWVRWTGMLAYLGFAVTAVSSFHSAAVLPDVAANYASGDAVVRAAIVALYTPIGASQIDGWGLLQFGGVGLWVLVVGVVGLRHRALARPTAYLAIALGAAWLTQTVGEVLRSQLVVGAAGLLGTVAGFSWFFLIGSLLRRGGAGDSTAEVLGMGPTRA